MMPNVLTFSSVIRALSRSTHGYKVHRCLQLLERMKDLGARGYAKSRPNSYAYNYLIDACATSLNGLPTPTKLHADPGNKPSDAFRIASQLFTQILSSSDTTLQADPYTYGFYLKACYHLLPNQGSITGSTSGDGTKTLETIATKAFQLASRNGQVSKEVIYWYQLACPEVDYKRMLGPDSLVQ
mmetsp:Transcript_30350/g.36924  ORF Transcript_30350/g.36924 Transcript_30350/m.36924 type:complete len:184 (-) Transcript_30350:162-713(-)